MNARRLSRPRQGEAGVTLVEMLVVLVLIGTLAGAAALAVGAAGRGPSAEREADLLVARLNRAADEVLLTGHAVRFARDDTSYRFQVRDGGAWVTHPLPILGRVHALPGGMSFDAPMGAEGGFAVGLDMVPSTGVPVSLNIAAPRTEVVKIVFDGLNARIAEVAG